MSALLQTPEPPARRRLAAYRTVRPDLVEVTMGGAVVGYLEIVGDIFVSLRGARYDMAVEVAQSMSIEIAHEALCGEAVAG